MTSPPSKTPATDFPALSLEDFDKAFLSAWAGDLDPGNVTSSPRRAAVHAAHEAVVVHARKRGVILVACSESADVKACCNFIHAFFTDQELLKQACKKILPDGVELAGGTRIICTADRTRRPTNLLSTISLVSDHMAKPVNVRDLARTIMFCTRDDPTLAKVERIMGVEPGELQRLRERIDARAAEGFAEVRAMLLEPKPEPAFTSGEQADASPDGLQPWEREELLLMQARENNVVELANRREPRVIRTRPR
jgi:hypothetical protein